MYTEKVNSPGEPKEIEITTIPGINLNEVWIRKNIRKETELRSDPDGAEESSGYVYEEVYFRTNATKEEIVADPEKYWAIGKEWTVQVPETDKQKIARLEKELQEANEALIQNRNDNDMAIAELTMAIASMI